MDFRGQRAGGTCLHSQLAAAAEALCAARHTCFLLAHPRRIDSGSREIMGEKRKMPERG